MNSEKVQWARAALAAAFSAVRETAWAPMCVVTTVLQAPEDEGLRAGFSWDSASATTLRSAFGGSGLSAQWRRIETRGRKRQDFAASRSSAFGT
eukprot:3422036-Pleurochrysis_carterae.AAC.3